MIRFIGCALAVAGILSSSSPALSGPNAGGFLVVHTIQAAYTTGDHPPMSGIACGEHDRGPYGTDDCPPYFPAGGTCAYNSADPTSHGAQGEEVFWWVLAAFAPDSCPRVGSVVFGITFDESVTITDSGPAPWGTTTDEWSTTAMGATVFFDPPRTSHLFEVYWFLGYSHGGPSNVRIAAHPVQQRMEFRDDSSPAIVDPVRAAGILGLGGAPGRNPLFDIPPVASADNTWGQIKSAFKH